MKVLMLTPYLPFPLLSGGQTRTYNLLKKLSNKHQITLFSFIRSNTEKQYVGELTKLGVEVQVFKRRPAWQIKNLLLAGLSSYPFLVAIYLSRTLRKRLDYELNTKKYDVVHAEPFYIVPNLPKLNVPLLLVDQTIEFKVYQHFVEKFKIPFLKPLLYYDVLKMKYWESKYWKMSDRVVAMSQEDKKMMQGVVPNLEIDIVPNGVDVNYFNSPKINPKQPIILFVGSCTWLQNREAIEILYKKIWPRILEKLPNAKLWIIGKSAEHFFHFYKSENVRVEEVKDIREAYSNATVMVAPIYGAGGTRYKNFEAFATGLPVVTTSIGIGGIEARDGQEVLIGETPNELTNLVLKLINNKLLYKKIAENAKELVRKKYDWDLIAEMLSKIYEELGSKNA